MTITPEKAREIARRYYYRVKADPEKSAARKARREVWYNDNKADLLLRQKEKKRNRKLQAIRYLGGTCTECGGEFHPAVFEFHHRDPVTKDRDPSKMLQLSWKRLTDELDKCDLVCANCHRLIHNRWECVEV